MCDSWRRGRGFQWAFQRIRIFEKIISSRRENLVGKFWKNQKIANLEISDEKSKIWKIFRKIGKKNFEIFQKFPEFYKNIFKFKFLRDYLIFFQKSGCVGKLWWCTIDIQWENIVPCHSERPYCSTIEACENLSKHVKTCENMWKLVLGACRKS